MHNTSIWELYKIRKWLPAPGNPDLKHKNQYRKHNLIRNLLVLWILIKIVQPNYYINKLNYDFLDQQ